MPEERAEAGFELEAQELAQRLDAQLLEVERARDAEQRAACIAAGLRTAHTLKGLAAMVGQAAIAHTCHLLEDLLKRMPRQPGSTDGQTMSLIVEAGSALCAAADAVREGKPCEELLQPVMKRLEAPATAGAAQAGQPPPTAPPATLTAGLAPAVRVTDDKLDTILGLSEEIHYAAAVLRMRQEQLDTLCEDFGLMLAKARRRADPASFGPWNALLARLEDIKTAMQRSTRTLQKVSGGLEQQLGGLRLVSLSSAFRFFAHAARDLAVALGKEVAFSIEDAGTALDRAIVESLREPLLHLIRNAVDHGLEPPAERKARGKPPQGQLRIIARPIGSWAEIAVEDDGRGIDLARVRQRAAELHLAVPGDDTQCVELLFHGGVSTKTEATEVSGRGLGLAIVHDRVEQLHGHVRAVTTAGRGSRFVITVPMALTRMRLLFLTQGPNVFGIPSTSIDRLVRATQQQVSAGLLEDSSGRVAATLHDLARVLGMRQDGSSAPAPREAFVLHDDTGAAAFLVDALLREDEAVVKSLGPRLKSAPAYLGGTLLPDGRVALVLNPEYLMRGALRTAGAAPPGGQRQARPHRLPARVIFVEDSDTLRAMGKHFLEQAGFEVHAAADGRQAWDLWKVRGADVIVSDIEMPVMDGLELTRAIRQSAGASVRIVLVSASGSEESRAAAAAAGADAFLTKDASLQTRLVELINNS